MASIHHRHNYISGVYVEGCSYNSVDDIREHVYLFYKKLFSRQFHLQFILSDLPLQVLASAQSDSLIKGFTEEEVFEGLCSCGLVPFGLNTAFLVLVPKFKGACDVKDFRPISLIHGLFKLVSKVLAVRLAAVLPNIISKNQFAFMKGRNIGDCFMIASQILHLAKKRKEEIILLKLDFQKALLQFSSALGFNKRQPFKEFWMERGVRQGDPLSPMLFVIAVEGLKALFESAKSKGLLEGVKLEGYSESISLLQFADDTLLFIPNNEVMLRNTLRILRCFELISGLKINFHKSSMVGVNVSNSSLQNASMLFNYKLESLPMTYLGLPLSIKPIKAAHWNENVNAFKYKFSLWKGHLLSPAGRLVLVKSVLSSLPVYFLSSLVMPAAIVVLLEGYMRSFLWHGSFQKTGMCKIAWSKIITDNPSSLWRTVIANGSNISSWADLNSVNRNVNSVSHIWRGILKTCILDLSIWEFYKSQTSISIGDGFSVRFWYDAWTGSEPFTTSFPDLFRLSMNQNEKVGDVFDLELLSWSRFNWRRHLRLGEQEHLLQLQNSAAAVICSRRQDRFIWQGNNAGYTPKTFISAYVRFKQHNTWNFSFIRSVCVPPRVRFFAWLLMHNRVSSTTFLFRRGIINIESLNCSFCSRIEDTNHIFIHCEFAWNYWNTIFNGCGLLWVSPSSKARNRRIFKKESTDIPWLVNSSISKAVNFYKSVHRQFPYSCHDLHNRVSTLLFLSKRRIVHLDPGVVFVVWGKLNYTCFCNVFILIWFEI
ncbi:uncharacterized protein LOC126671491 [Mercurialis annua]|uniref:uncharacterized protein LOC126671491 n=1 Tax=Mercurialis annua TaxID=3986 RepID=UPI00215F3A5E|nr:uncharacterized protein LOC126671491 [Mercurialis annua]